MSDKEKLQNMLDNLINQKPEQAQVDFHDYLQSRMKDVIGPAGEEATGTDDTDSDKE